MQFLAFHDLGKKKKKKKEDLWQIPYSISVHKICSQALWDTSKKP